jgi:hypothetical protein
MSMTPAPFTPMIGGHAPHSRADDHGSSPVDSAARIRESLSPGISDTIPGLSSGAQPATLHNRSPAASFA